MTLRNTMGTIAVSVMLAGTLALAGCAPSAPQTSDDAAKASGTTTEAPAKEADSAAETGTVSDGATSVEAVTFTDALGNEVTVENPQRVVACMGSFANLWELAGGTLVGASDDAFDTYTLTSSDVAQIGDFSEPNLEAIIALEPDFVILTSGSGGRGGDSSQVEFKETLPTRTLTFPLSTNIWLCSRR